MFKMDKKRKALIILKILKKEYEKYQKPVSTSIQERTKDPFKVLIATILSARARDIQTEKICNELFKHADKADKLAKISLNKLQKIIKSIGFYREKSKRIKNAAQYLLDNHEGEVPNNFDDLIKIPGVGRKTANVFLAEVHNFNVIGVDVHCHRVPNRIGLIKTKKPIETEKALEKLFPRNEWKNVNRAFVSHGQNVCRPIRPLCFKCPIEKYCNFKFKNLRSS